MAKEPDEIGVLQAFGIMIGSVVIGAVSGALLDAIPIRLFLIGLIISPFGFLAGLVMMIVAIVKGNWIGRLGQPSPPPARGDANALATLFNNMSEKDAVSLAQVLNQSGSPETAETRSPAPTPLVPSEPAAPTSPFGDALDAAEIRKIIIKQCCKYDDGSGEVNVSALRALMTGLKAFHVAEPLAASDLRSLGKLLHLLRRLSEAMKDKKERPMPGMDELRTAGITASKAILATGADAVGLFEVVSSACLQYDDASGQVFAGPARTLFDGMQGEPLVATLAESKIRDLNSLARILDKIGEAVGHPRVAGLDDARSAVVRASQPALRSIAESLATANDAEHLRKDIVCGCCKYDDASGHLYLSSARTIFAEFDVQKVQPALTGSSLESLTELYTVLRRLSKEADKPIKGLEELRQSVLLTMRNNLCQTKDAEELSDLVESVCSEYGDGSGEIFGRETRQLLQEFAPALLSEPLAASKPRPLNHLGYLLGRISDGLGHPRCPGLETLRKVVDEAIGTAVQAARLHVVEASDADALRTAITDACCEHSDGSGHVHSRSLRIVFEKTDVQAMAAAAQKGKPDEREYLAKALERMSKGLEGSRCPELEALRSVLAGRPLHA